MPASKISESLGIAVQMEQNGQRFYREAAERMTHPFGRQMFQSLTHDEERHERIFREMAEQEGLRPAEMDEIDREGPAKRISTIFSRIAKEIKEQLEPSDDDIAVLDKALELEEQAFSFYNETAQKTTDETEQAILRKIANEENEHYKILNDTRLYLTNPEEWHIKEEKPLIDGGAPA